MTLDVCDFIFSDGESGERPSGSEGVPVYRRHTIAGPQLMEAYYSESLEQSVSDTDVKDLNFTSIW